MNFNEASVIRKGKRERDDEAKEANACTFVCLCIIETISVDEKGDGATRRLNGVTDSGRDAVMRIF